MRMISFLLLLLTFNVHSHSQRELVDLTSSPYMMYCSSDVFNRTPTKFKRYEMGNYMRPHTKEMKHFFTANNDGNFKEVCPDEPGYPMWVVKNGLHRLTCKPEIQDGVEDQDQFTTYIAFRPTAEVTADGMAIYNALYNEKLTSQHITHRMRCFLAPQNLWWLK